MKRRFLLIVLAIISAICIAAGFAACTTTSDTSSTTSSSSSEDKVNYNNAKKGTYYLVDNGIVDESQWFILGSDSEDWSSSYGTSGSYWTKSGSNAYLCSKYKFFFTENAIYTGTWVKGVLTLEIDGETRTFWHSDSYIAYTVEFDTDGGNDISSYKIVKDYTSPSPANPVKNGYNFIGWTDDTSTSTLFSFDDTAITGNITLYAVWSPISYTATFIADGTTIDTVTFTLDYTHITEPAIPEKEGYTGAWQNYSLTAGDITINAVYTPITYTITYADTKGVANANVSAYNIESNIKLNDIAADGYTFMGWYNGDTKVTQISSGSMGDLTLTAKWSLNTYTITYEKLHGNDTTGYVTTYTIESDNITLPVGLTATGYAFNGWLDTDGNTVYVIKSGSYGNIVLTANFTPINYTISYRDTQSSENANPTTYNIDSDTITLSPLTFTGYTFIGWKDESGNIVTKITSGSYGDIMLTATWEAVTYTITYGNTKEADTSNFVTSYTIESGTITLPTEITSSGYNFLGWLDDDSNAVTQIASGSTGDVTLTASWEVIEYTITYGNTKEADTSNFVTNYTIESNTITLPTITSSGYTFMGWLDEDNNAVTVIPTGTTGNVTLTASWEAIEYTISYENLQGAENNNPATYTIEDKITLNELSLAGYNFLGWLDDSNNAVTQIPTGSMGSVTLTATWEAIEYTISYENLQGATNANPASYTIEDEITLEELTLTGYTFMGWLDEDNNAVTVIPTGTTGNLTLTASWEAVTYTVTYSNTKEADISSFVTNYTIESNTITLPTEITSSGYTFLGWLDEDSNAVTQIPTGSTGSLTLTATWEAIEYTISYENLQGATNSNPATYTVEDEITLEELTLTGYTFLGWLDEDNNAVTVIPTGTTGNLTLTASWEAVTYTITYGNTKEADTSGFVTNYTIESTTITLPTNITSSGYTFLGWLDEDSNAITQIASGSTGNVTLAATWEAIEYTISYENLLGAANNNPASYTVEDEITLEDLTLTGYTFLGWLDEDNNTVTVISTGTTGNLTFTATWEAVIYTITYSNTKEADTSSFVTNYTIESGTITLPEELTSAGCTFLGWLDEDSNAVTQIASGSYGNITLTASWELTAYTITYENLLGATNANPATYTVEDEITLVSAVRNGYAFLGWLDEDNNTVTGISTGNTGNVTYTASWELTTYTITYNNTYDTDTSGYVTTYTIESSTIILPADIVLTGYTFNGWLDDDGNYVTRIASGSYGNVTLTADLTPTTYAITLEPVSGTVSTTSYTVSYGENFTLAVPLLKGYTFIGWYTNTGSSGTQITDENGESLTGWAYSSDKILYAHYTAKTFTVTFDSNGGTAVSAQTYSYGSAFNPDSAVSTYDSYEFLGWFTADDVKYTSSTLVEMDVTLYAQWLYSIAISTADGLIAIADDPTANYHLTCDINLKGNIWTPIEEFSGTLLGNGYKIYNFILQTTTDSTFAFILTNSDTIDGVTLEDFTYTVSLASTSNYIGVLAAINNGTISNCCVTAGQVSITVSILVDGAVTYSSYYGNIAGYNSGTVSGCSNYVDITFTSTFSNTNWNTSFGSNLNIYSYIGGVVGFSCDILKNNYNNNAITTTMKASGGYPRTYSYFGIGGIAGETSGECEQCSSKLVYNGSSSIDSNSYDYIRIGSLAGINSGSMETCVASGTLNYGALTTPYMGGLVGENTSTGSIKSCHSSTVIKHTTGSGYLGGFAGYNSGVIQNSYATGDITSSVAGYVAGFVGENTSSGTITKCYATGNVNAADSSAGYFAASSSGTLYKCYYLKNSYLIINGVYYSYITEFNTVNGVIYQTLWSSEFLVDELYWEEESWIVVINGDPILEWEMYIDHEYNITVVEPTCDDFGYTLYECTDCGLFFIRDLVEAYGHTYDEGKVTLEPTCTDVGYRLYTCETCGGTYVETIDALGHTWVLIEEHEATCEHDAYNVYECSVCGETYTEVLEGTATGHTKLTTKEAIDPTGYLDSDNTYVFVNGYTAEIVCTDSDCDLYDENAAEGEVGYRYPDTGYVIIQAQTQTVEHTWILNETITEATCTQAGYGLYVSIYTNHSTYFDIPATGHTDADGNHICDTCGNYIDYETGTAVTEISTAEELLAIADDLNGIYMLTANIDLSGYTWTAIGSYDSPFTGYFNGNGYTISNLAIDGGEYGGLFGYSKGTIYNLTISGATITANNENSVIGLIAAYNGGNVVSCTVTGTVTIDISNSVTMSAFNDYNYLYTYVSGCMVGENQATGVINSCTVTASITITVTNTITITIGKTISSLFNKSYKKAITSTLSLALGIVSGRNSGTISGCTVELASDLSMSLSCVFDDSYSDNGKICTANANIYCYYGTYAGVDNGTTTNCTGTYNADTKTIAPNDDGVWFWERNSTVTLYGD